MVHNGIFATSDEILVKAGESYVGATAMTEARINALCLQAESFINATTRYNWSDAYAGLNADVKGLLAQAESDLVAMYIINFNLSSYDSLREAETMLDVLNMNLTKCLNLLKQKVVEEFMEGA